MEDATLNPLFELLDILGLAIFALTGALLAARLKQTFVTMAFFALVTGVGGGTVRDLLIGAPVFWVNDPWIAPICFIVALIVIRAFVAYVSKSGFSPFGWYRIVAGIAAIIWLGAY